MSSHQFWVEINIQCLPSDNEVYFKPRAAAAGGRGSIQLCQKGHSRRQVLGRQALDASGCNVAGLF